MFLDFRLSIKANAQIARLDNGHKKLVLTVEQQFTYFYIFYPTERLINSNRIKLLTHTSERTGR